MDTLDIVNLSRRDFLKAGTGLTLGLAAPGVFAQAGPGRAGGKVVAAAVFEPNAFVRIGTDNRVTVIVKHLEMGQGTYTGLPTLVAEELDADWGQIRVEAAPADASRYNNLFWGPAQGTGGSTAIANSWDQLRKAGATARAMLVSAAAQRWGVQPESLTVSRGTVLHKASGRKASFGQLAADAGKQLVPAEVKLKDPKNFVYIGKRVPRTDSRAKSTGTAMFTQDVKLPGMLTALVAHPPRFGAKVKSFDAARAKAVKGVTDVVAIPQGVAVLAQDFWTAKTGRDALAVEWDETDAFKLGTAEIMDEYRKLAATLGLSARRDGDVAGALAGAAKTLEAAYEFPYLAHAAMEPMNCVVKLSANACEVWNGEQLQTGDQAAVAGVVGLKPDQVSLHMLYAGGSFGRRANPKSDYVVEAAAIAKAINGRAPVKMVWTREDDMRAGYYRPLELPRAQGGARRAREHRRLAPPNCRSIHRRRNRVRRHVGQERHRRHLGRGREHPPLRHREPGRRAAFAENGRAGAVVALGGLDPHRVFNRDLPGRARRGRRQGPVRAAPRAARQAPAPQGRAGAGGAEGRLGQAARAGQGRAAGPGHRRARIFPHLRRAGGRGDGAGWAAQS